jgi:hypothetical protein
MTTYTVPALYKDGVLRPETKLDLPDNTLVQIEVTPVAETPTLTGSLFGAFPELAAISDVDLEVTRRAWEGGLTKQAGLLDDLA